MEKNEDQEIVPEDAFVMYREGPFQWNKVYPGLLTWKKDDHIELKIRKDGSDSILFDVPLNEIRKVGGALEYMTFYIKDKPRYRLSVSMASPKVLPTRSDILLNSKEQYEDSNVLHWIGSLHAKGVRVNYLRGKSFTFIILAATIGIIAVCSLIVYLVQHSE